MDIKQLTDEEWSSSIRTMSQFPLIAYLVDVHQVVRDLASSFISTVMLYH